MISDKFVLAQLTGPVKAVREMAQVRGVYSIQKKPTDGGLRSEMSSQINAGNTNNNIAVPGYKAWLQSMGVDGTGVIIANVDGGLDNNHPNLKNRLTSCTGTTCQNSMNSNHGTHTAGIMAADGSSGVKDADGFLRGLGVAPGAQLVEQVYINFMSPAGMSTLMTQSIRNGAYISGNSWGPSGSPQGYDAGALQVDARVRDADPDKDGNEYLLYVLSIMNGNGGAGSQGSPDEAKNIFTIGSTKMRAFDGSQIQEIEDISSNSAHGPCLHGRTIPHIVAPGCRVDSTTSGGGHGLMCGTSMASPQVSGAAALFVQKYRQMMNGETPSPALIKAAFIAVAKDLHGNKDADGNTLGHPFDNKQGWGRMDLRAVLDVTAGSVQYFDEPIVLTDSGDNWPVELEPVDLGKPVRIMLAWTDAPGHGLGGNTPAWNNDLNLVVETGGKKYLGNVFGADGYSVEAGSRDPVRAAVGRTDTVVDRQLGTVSCQHGRGSLRFERTPRGLQQEVVGMMRIVCIFPRLAAVCVCLGAAVAAADQAAFEQAAAATGQRYVQLRDQLLSEGFSRTALADAARSNDWRQRVTALALLGWRERGDEYSRLVHADKLRDLRGRERYVWSADSEQVDATLLPLAYEFLLKNTGGAAGQEAAARMIPYLVKEENSRDMKVLAGAIYDPELNQQSRVTIARVIANTPGDVFHVAELRKMIAAEPQRTQANREVVDWLLNGLVTCAGKTDQASKREITSWLAKSSDVSELVGRRRVVYALGADNAAPVVAKFLKRADSVADQRWAISNLSRMGTPEAANAIIRVLTRRTADPGIRIVAASSLGRVEYSSAVKNVLDEVMRDERLDPAVRRAAYDALNRQLEANRGNEDRVREIRDVLRGVDPGRFRKIPGLRNQHHGGDRGPR